MFNKAKNKRKTLSPTTEFYQLMTKAFEHFNSDLFERSLPNCIITVQREKNTMGYFSPDRWGNSSGEKAHEIAINPAYFANHKVVEILQTLVHEQCHMWQHIYGSPSRSGYHNTEWANKMQTIGLVPSETGEPGGKTTGQRMSDYPALNGRFIEACKRLIAKGYEVNWVDRIPAIKDSAQIRVVEISTRLSQAESILNTNVSAIVKGLRKPSEVAHEKKSKMKMKYHCNTCGDNAWGKPGLKIICSKCSSFDNQASVAIFSCQN